MKTLITLILAFSSLHSFSQERIEKQKHNENIVLVKKKSKPKVKNKVKINYDKKNNTNVISETLEDSSNNITEPYNYGWEKNYDRVRINCSNEMCGVVKNELYGFVDNNGYEIIKPQYLFANKFIEGYSCVQSNSTKLYGVINKKGETIIPFDYLTLDNDSESGYYKALKKGSKGYGVIDINNYVIIPFYYDIIEIISKDEFKITNNGNTKGDSRDDTYYTIDKFGNCIKNCENKFK